MTITSITKVGGEVSTITITRSSRLIVPSLAEITFTYLLDSLDWLRFSTVPSPRLVERRLILRTLDDFMVNMGEK